MFGFKKNGEENPMAALMPMITPMLKLSGINPDTMISDSAASLRKALDDGKVEIMATVQAATDGSCYIIDFFKQNGDAYDKLHTVAIRNLEDFMNAFGSVKENVLSLIQTPIINDEPNNTNEQLAIEQTGTDSIIEQPSPEQNNGTAASTDGIDSTGSDELDKPDAE